MDRGQWNVILGVSPFVIAAIAYFFFGPIAGLVVLVVFFWIVELSLFVRVYFNRTDAKDVPPDQPPTSN